MAVICSLAEMGNDNSNQVLSTAKMRATIGRKRDGWLGGLPLWVLCRGCDVGYGWRSWTELGGEGGS